MTASLPSGFYARPVIMEDLPAMIDMFNAFSRRQMGRSLFSIERIQTEWTSPEMDLGNNTMAVFTAGDQPAGYMEFWDTAEPHVSFFGWGSMNPEHLGKGIGSFLTDWLLQRARQNVTKAPEGARVALRSYAESHDQEARALFTSRGFQDIRTSHWMRIDFDAPPQPTPMPEGIAIRAVQGAADQRAAMRAAHEAFKDHWGHIDEPFERFYERQLHFLENDPYHDPSLWFMALDGDEVAGVSLCAPQLDGSPEMGWVNTLGVRRPWRKHGLGLALLRHSFCALHARGRACVGLSVDASSLTGATRLYEKAGMRVFRRSTLYELELRPGTDLTTQAI